MNAQHTPGPWVAKTYNSEFVSGQIPIYGNSDSIVVSDVGGRSVDQINANIRLIAAAPDLLAALRMVGEIWSHDQTANLHPESPLAIVRAALAKVEGA